MKLNIAVCWIFVLMSGCMGRRAIPYAINKPVSIVELKKELNEISGLQYISDSTVSCIQDEKANVYHLDSRTGLVSSKYDFGHNGDFEGIATYKNATYILKSDGDIFKSIDAKKAEKFPFKLGKNFEFEGLCMDAKHSRLLVACKTHGKKKKDDHIVVYGFSTLTNEYAKEPIYKIDKDDIDSDFRPSAIAIHPNGNIYIISSIAKMLLVLNKKGKVLGTVKLNPDIYHQPEGICFDSKGTLIISNEKNKTAPTLIRLEIQNL